MRARSAARSRRCHRSSYSSTRRPAWLSSSLSVRSERSLARRAAAGDRPRAFAGTTAIMLPVAHPSGGTTPSRLSMACRTALHRLADPHAIRRVTLAPLDARRAVARSTASRHQELDQLVLVRVIPLIIVVEDDDVVDAPLAQELRVFLRVRPAATVDALRKKLRIEPATVLDHLVHPDFAVGDAQQPVLRARGECRRREERLERRLRVAVQRAPGELVV